MLDYLCSREFIRCHERITRHLSFSRNPNNNEPKWTPVASDDLEYLHITTEADIMKKELLKDRYQFWNSLPLVSPPAQPPPKSATGVLGVVTSVIDTIKGFFGRIFGTN